MCWRLARDFSSCRDFNRALVFLPPLRCATVQERAWGDFSGAKRFLQIVFPRNPTTRDRQFEHAATRFCASASHFHLTDFSLLITLRPRIRGTVIRRTGGPVNLRELRKV